MKRNVLSAIAGIILLFISACDDIHNPFLSGPQNRKTTPVKPAPVTPAPVDSIPIDPTTDNPAPVNPAHEVISGIVNADIPVITVQPQSAAYRAGDTAEALTVSASVSDGGTLSYQWYQSAEDRNEDGTEISGATTANYTPSTAAKGAVYYYVIVTNTIEDNGDGGDKTAQAVSNTAGIGVDVILITMSGLSAVNKVYDGTTDVTITGTAQLEGVLDGDEVILVEGTAAFEDKNVGTDKAVILSGWSLEGSDADNYITRMPHLTADITAKPVTVTGLNAENKVYDGTTAAVVTGTVQLNGVLDGDEVTAEGTAAFADKNVGTGKAVTFSGWSLEGADAENYRLEAPPENVMANITVKPVTISVYVYNKSYDGTRTASRWTVTVIGKIDGDEVTAEGTAMFANANVGASKAVTLSDWSLSGADAGNYSLVAQPANVTASITKATGAAVGKPVEDGIDYTQINVKITGLPATGQSIEYAISTASNGTGLSAWKDSIYTDTSRGIDYEKFYDLNEGMTYYVYARSKENTNYLAGAISVSAGLTTWISVSSVRLDKTSLTLSVGETAILTATISPSNATNQVIGFGSSNKVVATTTQGFYDKYCTVTALCNGITVITVYTTDGKTAQCNVLVQLAEMVWIPAGTFTMGSPDTEAGRDSDEGPQHAVTLSGFWMGAYQVTQEQYQTVMGTNQSSFSTVNGREPASGEAAGKRPVEYVTWYDAVEFCNKLSALGALQEVYTISGRTPASGYPITGATVTADFTKNGFRLPTEAEWEYACRAGTTTAYNTGNTISDNTGWYSGNSGSKTHQVGLKPANAWGLYDMHGNVWEWCWDWYSSSYYTSSPATNPAGPAAGANRVVRGGYWDNAAAALRSASRGSYYPAYRNSGIGLRLVRRP